MHITLKRNDAFYVLGTILQMSEGLLERTILNKLIQERVIYGDKMEAGLSVEEILIQARIEPREGVSLLFPNQKEIEELCPLLEKIILWGKGEENPCPDCGCDLEFEYDAEITKYNCSNDDCTYSDHNDPDVDILPGGHDYKTY